MAAPRPLPDDLAADLAGLTPGSPLDQIIDVAARIAAADAMGDEAAERLAVVAGLDRYDQLVAAVRGAAVRGAAGEE